MKMFQQKETFLLLDLLTLKDFKDALKIRTSSKRLSQVIAYHFLFFSFSIRTNNLSDAAFMFLALRPCSTK